MGRWRTMTWGDVISLQRGFDITKDVQVMHGKIPVVSSGGIGSYHDKAMNDGPGVVIGRKGTLGRVYYVDGPFWPHDTTLWVKDFKGNNPRFVYYALKGIDPSHLNVGSASPTLNRNHVHPLPVNWPTCESEQRGITEVLGALDDKIAANDRAAATSRELANARFIASARGNLAVQVSDVVELLRRGVTPRYAEHDGMLVLNQKCVRDQRVSLEPARLMEPLSTRLDRVLRENDVLVNSTGAGTLGRAARWTHNTHATVDSHITIVRFSEQVIDPVCAGFALLRLENQIESLAEGSTGQTELRRELLGGLMLEVPARSAQRFLGEELSKHDALERSLIIESRKLADTRDELLPLLMSGKLRVKDAEAVTSEVL